MLFSNSDESTLTTILIGFVDPSRAILLFLKHFVIKIYKHISYNYLLILLYLLQKADCLQKDFYFSYLRDPAKRIILSPGFESALTERFSEG